MTEIINNILNISNTSLNEIFNNIDDGIITVNLNNIILSINSSAEKIFSLNKYQIKSLNININELISRIPNFNNIYKLKIINNNETNIYIIKFNFNSLEKSFIKNDFNEIREKECFLFNISHEIRTPLNGIIGMTQILKDKVDGNFQEYIDIISSCGNQLMDILNDILDYAKITSGNISLFPTNFNLHQCLEEIHDIILSKISSKKIDINFTIDSNIPENIFCDKKRLKQILLNLLSNAIKFTEKGTIKTNVSIIKRVGIKIYLMFSVIDTGIGIPSSYLEKIFEPYIQVNNKLSRKYDGTGLGLSICKQLSKLLNGDIKVDSILGYGSTFILTIEVVDPIYNLKNIDKNCDNNNIISMEHSPLPIYNNISCLVIDDNSNNRIALYQMLASLGIKTILASSAAETFIMIPTYTFDIIFLDICMPKIDGTKTCNELRSKNITIPIIATSSIDSTQINFNLFDDVLIKPIKRKSLIRVLDKFIIEINQDENKMKIK